MSLRPKEAFEASQTFSLRKALGPSPSPAATTQLSPAGMHFDLSFIGKPGSPNAVLPPACQPVQAPAGLSLRFEAAPVQPLPPPSSCAAAPQQARALPNLSFTSMSQRTGGQLLNAQQVASQAKEAANSKADVMRLSAYVDELTQRLRKLQGKLEQTECQLTRTSQVLCHERQTADRMLANYKKDLATSHETEEKLRAELAGSKKKTALQDSAFMASVGTALASDEQMHVAQRNLQELETKVTAMGDFKVKLEVEVAKIEGLRDAANNELAELQRSCEQQVSQTKEAAAELVAAQRALSDARGAHGEMTERMAATAAEEATLAETLGALRAATTKAESEAGEVKSKTHAVLLEHGEASRSLADVKRRVVALQAQELEAQETLQKKAYAMDDVPVFELDTPAVPVAPRRMTVTGALAPDRQLCTGVDDTATACMARDGFGGSGIAAVLATDAPIDLTLQRISFVGAQHRSFLDTAVLEAPPKTKAADPTATMVNAVVGDLKMKLQEISQQQPVWRQVAPLA